MYTSASVLFKLLLKLGKTDEACVQVEFLFIYSTIIYLQPRPGIEPGTCALRVRRSAR
ncbi:hypothetical protein SPIRO4BDMA_50675 [uncultured spirochete]|uniref:Uncharacterized protein n=1 Tax=uncultured spirochete TaxID=156406 RepID=A0A3P3XSD1_9SPIR|nr:hypothetical protein SPIRO4BDMA_50675 [uncultured spirochete]